jgi:hypothetical protein
MMSAKKVTAKKEQFTQPQKSRLPLLAGILAVIAVVVVVFVRAGGSGQAQVEYFGEPVAASRSYIGQIVAMTRVEPVIEDGEIRIPFADVDRYNIVYFEAENDEGTVVPLMAYITPSGRLFVGSSMCEPCRGRTFSLAGETLLCDTCRTTYTIEEHKFISGAVACGSYPPVNMNGRVEDGNVVFDQAEVLNWRIRAL